MTSHMSYLRIPTIEQPVSRLIMGTMVFQPGEMELTRRLLDGFVEAGGTALDTARRYGSEEQVGTWLASRGIREQLVLIGKGAHPDDEGRRRVTPGDIEEDLALSLDALGVDYFDLYLLHRDDPQVPVAEIIDTLNDHLRAGRIRAIGVSNWSIERIAEANAYAESAGLSGIVASSPNVALAVPNEPQWDDAVSIAGDQRALEWHEATQIAVLAWSSQARGFFSSRSNPDDLSDSDLVRVWYSDPNFERKRRATQLAAQHGVTESQIALAWVLRQPFPTAALIGPATPTEAAESYGGLGVSLTDEEASWLNLERNAL